MKVAILQSYENQRGSIEWLPYVFVSANGQPLYSVGHYDMMNVILWLSSEDTFDLRQVLFRGSRI
jgi:hypothetical protein